LLAHSPARYAVTPEAASSDKKMVGLRALGIIATYVIIVGIGAFLEKPALKGLDATQFNGLMAIAMTAVAGVALALRGPRLPMTRRTLGGFGVGAMIGIASVFSFLEHRFDNQSSYWDRDRPRSARARMITGDQVYAVNPFAVSRSRDRRTVVAGRSDPGDAGADPTPDASSTPGGGRITGRPARVRHLGGRHITRRPARVRHLGGRHITRRPARVRHLGGRHITRRPACVRHLGGRHITRRPARVRHLGCRRITGCPVRVRQNQGSFGSAHGALPRAGGTVPASRP
jgi:hypothetical protein